MNNIDLVKNENIIYHYEGLNNKQLYVYFIQEESEGKYIKVGKSRNIGARIESFITTPSVKLNLLHYFHSNNFLNEYVLHKILERYQVEHPTLREWFHPNDDIFKIIDYCKKDKFKECRENFENNINDTSYDIELINNKYLKQKIINKRIYEKVEASKKETRDERDRIKALKRFNNMNNI